MGKKTKFPFVTLTELAKSTGLTARELGKKLKDIGYRTTEGEPAKIAQQQQYVHRASKSGIAFWMWHKTKTIQLLQQHKIVSDNEIEREAKAWATAWMHEYKNLKKHEYGYKFYPLLLEEKQEQLHKHFQNKSIIQAQEIRQKWTITIAPLIANFTDGKSMVKMVEEQQLYPLAEHVNKIKHYHSNDKHWRKMEGEWKKLLEWPEISQWIVQHLPTEWSHEVKAFLLTEHERHQLNKTGEETTTQYETIRRL